MPTSINYPPDARGKWSRPTLLALISLAVLSFLVYAPPSKSRMLDKLTSRLREEKFEQLYDEARDNVRLNVSKEKFVKRMKAAVAKLKAIDPGLNFQRDPIMEKLHSAEEPGLPMASLKLQGNGKSVMVLFNWDREGRFIDMGVTPDGPETPQEYAVYSVSCQQLHIGGKTVDY